jgi:hypothetical protein
VPEVPAVNIKASLFTLGALMLAPALSSAKPATEPHGSVAGLAGVGIDTAGADVFFGLGLRGGYTLRQNIYIGGTFMYHFVTSGHLYFLGAEGGYDFQLEPVMIRPYIGVGYGNEAFGREGGREFSATAFGFWFGGTVLFNLNEQWFIGGDFKLPIFTGAELFLFPTPSLTGGLNF